MKILKKISLLLLVMCLALGSMTACGNKTDGDKDGSSQNTENAAGGNVDYASQVKLDMTSGTAKQEVTVKLFVDGDTTHFYVPTTVMPNGVLKARYLAVNTPESTGKIEEYGKKASQFTREKLESATSIIIESETATWTADSTGDRYLAWVWYKTDDMEDYRNLNIELLQNGLAIASSSANNQYGEVCMAAINQAKANKLNVHSGEKDPDYYYGEAVELTLKELRTNIESYVGMDVAFNGVVTVNSNSTAYVESYDPETDMYFGMTVYYGYNLSGAGLEILNVGNEVRIVGSVQYYEAGGTYQVSDIEYRMMKPDDPGNIQKLSDGKEAAFPLVSADQFANGKVTIATEDAENTYDFGELALNSSISMNGLKVVDTYTTMSEDSSSKGAMTLTCKAADGTTISVRTEVLVDENGNLVTADQYMGKTINVKGIVDYYNGNYQIKVFSAKNITIN